MRTAIKSLFDHSCDLFFTVFQIHLHRKNIDVHIKWLLPFNACHIVQQQLLFKVAQEQCFEN